MFLERFVDALSNGIDAVEDAVRNSLPYSNDQNYEQYSLQLSDIIFNEDPDAPVALKDYLKMHLRSYMYYAPKDEYKYLQKVDYTIAHPEVIPVKVIFFSTNYNPDHQIEVVISTPRNTKNYPIQIHNLQPFIEDYARITGTYLTLEDILNSKVHRVLFENGFNVACVI